MAQPQTSSESDQTKTREGVLVQGSVWKAIWTMSWPLLLMTMSTSLIGLVDMHVAGKLGSAPQAAVGLSEQILFLFMVFIMSIGVGTTALVSRASGAGDNEGATRHAAQSLSLSFFMGLILCALCISCAAYALELYKEAPGVKDIARQYLSVYSFYLIPFSITCVANSAFRAVGNAKIPLLIVACMTVVTIYGDFATVVWNWPIAGLGLRGIPASGICGSTLGTLMGLFFLSRSEQLKGVFGKLWPLSLTEAKRVLKVGIPSGLQRLGWSLSVFVLFFILKQCPNPTQAIASWTIGMRLEALLFMPLMALSLSVSSIVGQNLGAHRVDRAVSAGWRVTGIGAGLMVVLGALLYIFAPELARHMTSDPIAIDYTVGYLRINAFCEPLLALTMILGGALQGAGDTRTPMFITVASHWVVRLPIAWLLALHFKMGPYGAWTSMATSVLVSSALTTWRFQSKAWAKIKV